MVLLLFIVVLFLLVAVHQAADSDPDECGE
jgi:hypothetical protein